MSDKLSKNNAIDNSQNLRQSYGNVILIHQTATTATKSPSSSSLSVLDKTPQLKQDTENSQALKSLPNKQHASLASTVCAYLSSLFHGKKENNINPANNIAKDLHQLSSAWWKRKGFKRQQQDEKINQKFLWCFRPIGAAAAALEKKQDTPLFWTTFEKKNQSKLTAQFEKIRTVKRTNDCCELQDKKINGGKVIVTVMLKEGIAFVLDPEWSEPMTFEITQLPKLTLYQRLRARHDYKRWYKKQQQQQQQLGRQNKSTKTTHNNIQVF